MRARSRRQIPSGAGMKRLMASDWRRESGLARAFFAAGLMAAATSWAGAGLAGDSASLIASAEPGWPQFRGPRRDGLSDERGLLPTWPEGGPRLAWKAAGLGRGYSSPVIVGDRLFLTGDFGAEVRVLACDRQGKPIWSAANGDAWRGQYPGARSSVTYSAGRIYHENAHGRVACLDATNGREQWAIDLHTRFRGDGITWGVSECLVVDDRAVYATAGGREALLVALDKQTGAELWRCGPMFDQAKPGAPELAGYSPPILIRFANRRLLVGCSQRHLFCVDADSGKMQWTRERRTTYSVIAMAPVLVRDAIFMAAPHGPPGQLHRLVAPVRPGDAIGVEDGWTTSLDTCQGGVVYANGRLFGSYYSRRGWAALDASTGVPIYETSEHVKGSVLHAEGRLYVLCEDGWMLLVDAAAPRFEVAGRFRVTTGRERDVWAHPVILDGQLYLRYHDTLWCYDIHATRHSAEQGR